MYLRNTLNQELISLLALIHIEKSITVNTDEVLTRFLTKGDSRKTQFLN